MPKAAGFPHSGPPPKGKINCEDSVFRFFFFTFMMHNKSTSKTEQWKPTKARSHKVKGWADYMRLTAMTRMLCEISTHC